MSLAGLEEAERRDDDKDPDSLAAALDFNAVAVDAARQDGYRAVAAMTGPELVAQLDRCGAPLDRILR